MGCLRSVSWPTANVDGKWNSSHYIIKNHGVVWDTLVNIPISVLDWSTFVSISTAQSGFVIFFRDSYMIKIIYQGLCNTWHLRCVFFLIEI